VGFFLGTYREENMAEYIIAKATAAASSDTQFVDASPMNPVTFAVAGALGSDEIDVYVVDKDGGTTTLYDSDGVAVVMTATTEPLSFYAPIWLKFTKADVSAAAAGVMRY
jgi:hypothetical protein